MVPLGTKALFALAVAGVVGAIAYGAATNDSAGTMALTFVAIGAVALGLIVAFAGTDFATQPSTDGHPIEQSPVGGRPLRPSLWPLGAAVGVGLLAIAGATNAVVVIAASVVLLVTGVGWLFQHWTEDPAYNYLFGRRLKERFVVPFGLPVAMICLVGVITISLSRVFLALSEQGTRGVALAVAIVVLLSAFAVAASERMARTAMILLSSFALVAVIGAGIAGGVHGSRKFEVKNIEKTVIPAPGQRPSTASTSASTTTPAP